MYCWSVGKFTIICLVDCLLSSKSRICSGLLFNFNQFISGLVHSLPMPQFSWTSTRNFSSYPAKTDRETTALKTVPLPKVVEVRKTPAFLSHVVVIDTRSFKSLHPPLCFWILSVVSSLQDPENSRERSIYCKSLSQRKNATNVI